jgi:hypothetical protein
MFVVVGLIIDLQKFGALSARLTMFFWWRWIFFLGDFIVKIDLQKLAAYVGCCSISAISLDCFGMRFDRPRWKQKELRKVPIELIDCCLIFAM